MRNHILLFALGIVSTAFGDVQTGGPVSEWILLTGKDGEKSWWTVAKLAPLKGGAVGEYEGAATVSKVLVAVFNSDKLLVDPGSLAINPKAVVSVAKDQSAQSMVEAAAKALFVGKNIRFSLGLPLEQADPEKWPAFIYDPIIVKVTAAKADHALLQKLTRHVYDNKRRFMGESPEGESFEGRKPEELAMLWESTVLKEVAGISIKYSSSLDTFFFTMPKNSEKAFYDICESVLSGNR